MSAALWPKMAIGGNVGNHLLNGIVWRNINGWLNDGWRQRICNNLRRIGGEI
jgi:hypothetical protein